MDAEDLEITPTAGPRCAGVRDLIAELLERHSVVSRVAPVGTLRGDTGLRAEIGGLDFDIWIEPS
ncbi:MULTISPECIES: hypothetical protein [unclassified Streptomyces]|uniref:hypothetical protein n=1 Tax=unclassified Streptomyces TaxID=2593676 RepID=UPI00093B0DF8|nr:hypothetical protein [Streptomyces sp. TSRI0281]OKI37102.1 hypothetical protein A6A29_41085 [Streptomyces sp. TSRI0281]